VFELYSLGEPLFPALRLHSLAAFTLTKLVE
jgi:hypothetical protein